MRSITQMAWFVKDINFPGLKSNHGIADLGYERAAWFRDTEGNLLALGQLA